MQGLGPLVPPLPSSQFILWRTEPSGAIRKIYEMQILSAVPSLVVLVYVSSNTIPRDSSVTVKAKVTLPDGVNPVPGMLPTLYIYEPGGGTLVQQQTMNGTGDPTEFELPYYIGARAPLGIWPIRVVAPLFGQPGLDTQQIPGFTVT